MERQRYIVATVRTVKENSWGRGKVSEKNEPHENSWEKSKVLKEGFGKGVTVPYGQTAGVSREVEWSVQ